MSVFLYITIVIIAFVYVVIMRSTIELEAKSIGTLRALGYTESELIRHYSLLPIVVTFVAAIIANVLGYALFTDYFLGLYTNSYSLIPGPLIWNPEAFVLTTVVPICIIVVIVYGFLVTSLSLPKKFLRGTLNKRKQKRAFSLGKLSFISRFRLRFISQNSSAYLVLLVGIFLGSLLMSFGLMMSPLLDHHREDVLSNKICAYQYILRMPVEVEDDGRESLLCRKLNSMT